MLGTVVIPGHPGVTTLFRRPIPVMARLTKASRSNLFFLCLCEEPKATKQPPLRGRRERPLLTFGLCPLEFGQWDCHAPLAMATSSCLCKAGFSQPKQSRWGCRRHEIATSFSRRTRNDNWEGFATTRGSGAKPSQNPPNRQETLTRSGNVIYSIRQLQGRRRVCRVPGLERTVRIRQCTGGVCPRLVLDSSSRDEKS